MGRKEVLTRLRYTQGRRKPAAAFCGAWQGVGGSKEVSETEVPFWHAVASA